MTHTNQIALLCACVLMVLGTGAALAQQSPVTISFAWYGDPAITKDYETLVARFEELNPDVRVEMLRWGWTADATQKFVVQVATGVAPDVFMIPTIVEGALLPLDDLLASEPGLAEQYVPGSLDYMRATVDEYGITRRGEGPIIGLPMYSLATAIAYNQDMFARAGIENPTDWTYEEYADIARRLTQDTDGDGVPNIWGAQWHIQSNTGIGPIIAAHSDWPVYLTDPFDTIVNTIEVQNAIDVLRRWIQEMHIHPAPAVGRASFPGGTAATNQGHNESFMSFPAAIGDQFAWDIAPMPVGPKGRKSWASHLGAGINSQTPHVDAAWRFLKFLTSAEGGILQSQSTTRLSSNLDAVRDFVMRVPFNAGVILQSFDYSIPEQIYIPGTDLATALMPVWNGEESVQAATERIEANFLQRAREVSGQN